jgi:hypothetical protein
MKFDYLTDNSERSLAPFFSLKMLSTTFNSVLIVSGLCLVLWPTKSLFAFIANNKTPLLFFEVFSAILVINAYINLKCGRGEIFESDYPVGHQKEVRTHERERNFFRYGLIGFLIHTFFLILTAFPLLIIAASISNVSNPTFAAAFSVVFAASFFCRMSGFMLYLFGGRLSVFDFYFSRVIGIVFLFATAFLAPWMNPIYVLYRLSFGIKGAEGSLPVAYVVFIFTALGANALLVILSHIRVRHLILKESVT